jgi:hypothetical protein
VFSKSVGEAVHSREIRAKKTPDRRGPEQPKSEVTPEDKSLVNVLYICEANNCDYNCEYPNKFECQIRSQQLFSVAETLTRDNITETMPKTK